MLCPILCIKIEIGSLPLFFEDMSNSKQCYATWFEVIIILIICTIIGAAMYLSMRNVPVQKENVTMESNTPVRSNTPVQSKMAANDPVQSISFVPIQQPTPKPRPLKLITINPDGNR
jgi:hypothetical protein